jgi:hypothetical protein
MKTTLTRHLPGALQQHVALQLRQPVDVEPPVEMVDLVLDRGGPEALEVALTSLPVSSR